MESVEAVCALLDRPIVSQVDETIAKILRQHVIPIESKYPEWQRFQISLGILGISTEALGETLEMNRDAISRFAAAIIATDVPARDSIREFASEEKDRDPKIVVLGVSQWSSVHFAIYFHLMEYGRHSDLKRFLIHKRIPHANEFAAVVSSAYTKLKESD